MPSVFLYSATVRSSRVAQRIGRDASCNRRLRAAPAPKALALSRSAELACAAEELLSICRRTLPQTSRSQVPESCGTKVDEYAPLARGGGDHSGAARPRAVVRPRGVVGCAQDREQGRLRFPDQRARLFVSGCLRCNGLVRDFDLFDEECEFGILIKGPPVAAIERVARSGESPALELLERLRDGRRFGDVIGADGASAKRESEDQRGDVRSGAQKRSASHPTASTAISMGERNHSRKTRRCTTPNSNDATPSHRAARGGATTMDRNFFTRRPRPPAIALTTTMPDDPLNINSMPALAPFGSAMCCSGDSRWGRRPRQAGWRCAIAVW